MDTNLILTLIGLAITVITVIGGVILFIISQSSKISKLEGRLDTLASENRLQDKVDKIHDESIRKLQQRATELHDTTQTQLDHLAADIAQQQTQVHTSLQVLKTQEASSVAVLTERAQQLVQQFQAIEQSVQQLRSTTREEFARLMDEMVPNRITSLEQLQQDFHFLVGWIQLGTVWQDIFANSGMKGILTEEEWTKLNNITVLDCAKRGLLNLEPLRNLTNLQTLYCGENQLTSLEPLRALTGLQNLYCNNNQLTSLEPLRACTGLQTLHCYQNQLTSLEPLHGLKNLKQLWCGSNSSLSQQEIERFKQAVPACKVQI